MPYDDHDDLYDEEFDFGDDEELEGEEDSDLEEEEVEEKPKRAPKKVAKKSPAPRRPAKPKAAPKKKRPVRKREEEEEEEPEEEAVEESTVDPIEAEDVEEEDDSSLEPEPASGEESGDEFDEFGRPAPIANYVVHIYEHHKYKRTIERDFTPEDAETFATDYNKLAKSYGRVAQSGKKESQPKKMLDD